MREPDLAITVICDWIQKAENDLKNAAYTLGLRDDCPTDTVCFHAQQCVEKYLKAFLVFNSIDFGRTHDIEALVSLLPGDMEIGLTVEDQRRMTGYATVFRYPGEYEPLFYADTRRAVLLARRVRREIRKLLPRNALRLRRK